MMTSTSDCDSYIHLRDGVGWAAPTNKMQTLQRVLLQQRTPLTSSSSTPMHTRSIHRRRALRLLLLKTGSSPLVGDTEEIAPLAGADTRVIDAEGRTVTPGIIDGHSHVSGNSPEVAGVDISYIADKLEWLEKIREADARMPDGEWMTGGYWDHTLSDGLYPTKEMLDSVVANRPVFLRHIDGHYAWVNSLALEMANITADTEVPPGGEIVIDPESGEPSGMLLEGAMSIVSDIIPERSDEQRHDGLAKMHKYANSLGITGLHQMGGLEDYLHIVENGDPTLRIWYGDWGRGGRDEPIAETDDQDTRCSDRHRPEG